jgi:SOS-response transcriptional repressor LexA
MTDEANATQEQREASYKNRFPLTKRQEEILEYVKKHNKEHGFIPSIRAISLAFGKKNTSFHYTINQLCKKGLLRKTPSGAIFIPPTPDEQ